MGLAEGNNSSGNQDTKGDIKAAEAAAKNERERVDLIFATASTVIAAAKQATSVPIVFASAAIGRAKLVDDFARPGGRLTGVHLSSAT